MDTKTRDAKPLALPQCGDEVLSADDLMNRRCHAIARAVQAAMTYNKGGYFTLSPEKFASIEKSIATADTIKAQMSGIREWTATLEKCRLESVKALALFADTVRRGKSFKAIGETEIAEDMDRQIDVFGGFLSAVTGKLASKSAYTTIIDALDEQVNMLDTADTHVAYMKEILDSVKAVNATCEEILKTPENRGVPLVRRLRTQIKAFAGLTGRAPVVEGMSAEAVYLECEQAKVLCKVLAVI